MGLDLWIQNTALQYITTDPTSTLIGIKHFYSNTFLLCTFVLRQGLPSPDRQYGEQTDLELRDHLPLPRVLTLKGVYYRSQTFKILLFCLHVCLRTTCMLVVHGGQRNTVETLKRDGCKLPCGF